MFKKQEMGKVVVKLNFSINEAFGLVGWLVEVFCLLVSL